MDFFITILRFLIAIIISTVIIIFLLALFLLETVLVLVCFPFAAICMKRDEIKNSWIGNYPNSLKNISKSLERVWTWVFSD